MLITLNLLFPLYEADSTPVSYTHLDVYKRQDNECFIYFYNTCIKWIQACYLFEFCLFEYLNAPYCLLREFKACRQFRICQIDEQLTENNAINKKQTRFIQDSRILQKCIYTCMLFVNIRYCVDF